jgi:hypothetical protein
MHHDVRRSQAYSIFESHGRAVKYRLLQFRLDRPYAVAGLRVLPTETIMFILFLAYKLVSDACNAMYMGDPY